MGISPRAFIAWFTPFVVIVLVGLRTLDQVVFYAVLGLYWVAYLSWYFWRLSKLRRSEQPPSP